MDRLLRVSFSTPYNSGLSPLQGSCSQLPTKEHRICPLTPNESTSTACHCHWCFWTDGVISLVFLFYYWENSRVITYSGTEAFPVDLQRIDNNSMPISINDFFSDILSVILQLAAELNLQDCLRYSYGFESSKYPWSAYGIRPRAYTWSWSGRR